MSLVAQSREPLRNCVYWEVEKFETLYEKAGICTGSNPISCRSKAKCIC